MELASVWQGTTKAVTERLEQCCVLKELLRRFQVLRGEVDGTLQKAESTIHEKVSYIGKDNTQRLHMKVQETKAELSGLEDTLKEIRIICWKLNMNLQQIPECNLNPFEREADALMDHWLDISERTDSHLEILHLGVSLWDWVVQLGVEVDNWAKNKLAHFAPSPEFCTEVDVKALQNEIRSQEGNMECFHRRATEVGVLLQSTEPPLELQVMESQMRNKVEEFKNLVTEALSRQTKRQTNEKDFFLGLSGSDPAETPTKVEDLHYDLQTQDLRSKSPLTEVHAVSSILRPESHHSLYSEENCLWVKVQQDTRQQKTHMDVLHRLQKASEHLEQWSHAAELKEEKKGHLWLLQEETYQQRNSFQHTIPAEKTGKQWEQYHNFTVSVSEV
ncbi:nesprin-2-like [Dunckerocampus dactyliophorus]|uniref:nesprin-2-like n=1 Tax=Dunckerocampus dactyliophorus TaxID=161453 RepID=UPI0024071288|nr:nesprin-2-like [Dunckerocampus dactyliophorus]